MGEKKNSYLLALAVAAMICGVMFMFVSSLTSVQAATQPLYQYGDANNDGNVDSFDLGVNRNIVLAKSPWNPYGDASGDGMIDSFDLGVVRNIILVKDTAQQGYEAYYDFNTVGAGTYDLAVWNNVPSQPTDTYINESGWTGFSGRDHNDIKAVDTDSFPVSGRAGNKSVTECRFTVDEIGTSRSCISALGIEVRGNTPADATMQYWAWNFDSDAWVQVGGDITIGTTEATYVKWSENWGKVFANYINAQGHVYILSIIDTDDTDQIIDYIKLKLVTGCQGPTPTPTESPSPTVTGTGEPTLTPTELPTQTATIEPTLSATVTESPTILPTGSPTVSPTPIPTLVICEYTYDFMGVSAVSGPHDAYYLSVYNMPPPHWRWYLLKTEATDGEYAAISVSDDSRWQTADPYGGRHVLTAYEMIVGVDRDSVSKIDLVFEGYGEVDSGFEIWAYNFVTNKGDRIGSRMDIPTGSDSVMIRSITSHCSDYINDDGKVIWGVYEKETNHHSNGYWMVIDYVKLVATTACP